MHFGKYPKSATLQGTKKGLPEKVGQAKCPSVVLGRHGRLDHLDHPGHRDQVCHGLHWALAQDADLRLVLAHLVSDHRVFHRDQVLQALVLALDRAQVLVLAQALALALDPGLV